MTTRSLRRPLLVGTALAVLVALPALVARPWADERFVMYMPEALVGANPLLLWDQVMREVTAFIDVGVFRPLSRLGFYLEHWLVVRVGVLFGVAPNVGMSVVKVAVTLLLLATGLLTIDQYRRVSHGGVVWSRTAMLLPIIFAGSLVLVNPAVHPLTLFPGLYIGTASLALLTPVVFGSVLLRRVDPQGGARWFYYAISALWGVALASMIELAWLGIPLALTHVALLHWARNGALLRGLWATYAGRMWLALAAGFTAVFVPARLFIASYCSTGGCYGAAEPDLGLNFLGLLPFRIGSALAPVGLLGQFRILARLVSRPSLELLIAVAVGIVAMVVLWWSLRELNGETPFGGGSMNRTARDVGPVAGYYAVVILLASIISGISSGLQAKGFNPAPWRETGFGWIAWSVLLAVGLALLLERVSSRVWLGVGVALVGLTFLATTLINWEDMRRVDLDEEGMLHIQAGQQLVDFDPGANAERCATIDGLRKVAGSDSELTKMNLVAAYLDAAARNHYGVVFCDSS